MDCYWNRKTFCLITGASRGIGHCIAIEFAKKVASGSVFLLLARSLPGLNQTKEEIYQNRGYDVTISVASVDLGKPDSKEYKFLIESSLQQKGCKPSDFDHVMIVQNAASLGIQNGLKVAEMDNLDEVQDYYSFNLNSFITLNATFLKVFSDQDSSKQLRSVVHISSLGAVEPFRTWGLYCAAKAARDMLLKSLALESGVHTLNWAPGSVNTDIYDEAVKHTADPELAKYFIEERKAGKVLTCEQTVTKLMRVLSGQQFIKGEHVAYNDID